jgi:transcriptional regulator with XRE-family HTH domain
MNIETANRLYQYRKAMGISQEELAERIGVSRQAVSKWERAESSPDTDNLIELAKVYGVSLDELLQGKSEASDAAETAAPADAQPEEPAGQPDGFTVADGGEHVHVGWDGIHVHDKNGTKVDIDRKHGIFVTENGEQKVYTDADGHVHKSPDIEAQSRHRKSPWLLIPYPILTVIAYCMFGYFNVCGGWGFGWIIFLTIPIYYSLIDAITKRDANHFAYPVLAAIIFLVMGFAFGLWHPGWVIFLTIPVYYGIAKSFRR